MEKDWSRLKSSPRAVRSKQIAVANHLGTAHARIVNNGRAAWPRAIENPKSRKRKRSRSSQRPRAKRARRQAGNRPSDRARKNSSNRASSMAAVLQQNEPRPPAGELTEAALDIAPRLETAMRCGSSLLFRHDLFRKPVSIPDQVRDMLFVVVV